MKLFLRIGRVSQVLLCMLLGSCFLLLTTAAFAASLQPDDCQKCHSQQIEEIKAKGGKHRDRVSCTDCHQEHPPKGANAIPECGMCHQTSGNPHFSSPNCLSCHRPHSPLEIDFTKATLVRPACMTCHPAQGKSYTSIRAIIRCSIARSVIASTASTCPALSVTIRTLRGNLMPIVAAATGRTVR